MRTKLTNTSANATRPSLSMLTICSCWLVMAGPLVGSPPAPSYAVCIAFASLSAVSRYSAMISGAAPPACSSASKSWGWIRNRDDGESEAAICASFTGPCTSSWCGPESVLTVRTSPAVRPCRCW